MPTKQVPGCTSVCMIGASPRPCKTELCCGCGCTCCCDCGCFWGQPPSAASPGSGKLLSHSSSNNMCPRYLVQTMVTMKRVVNVPSTYRGLLTWLGPYKNRRSVATVPVDSVVDMQHTQVQRHCVHGPHAFGIAITILVEEVKGRRLNGHCATRLYVESTVPMQVSATQSESMPRRSLERERQGDNGCECRNSCHDDRSSSTWQAAVNASRRLLLQTPTKFITRLRQPEMHRRRQ